MAHNTTARLWIAPIMKTGPQLPLLAWIATWAVIVATVIFDLHQSEGMLPLNRMLFAFDTALMMAWLLALILERPDDHP